MKKSTEEKQKTSRQLQAERMRLKLQNIVEKLAREKPLDSIKIQDICSEAGVSAGNFYQYFSSKEEALIFSYNYIDKEWEKLELEKIEDPLDRLREILKTHLSSIANGGICFISQLFISQLKIYSDYFFSDSRYLVSVTREAVRQAQDKALITDSQSPEVITEKLLNFSRGLSYNYCIKHNPDSKAWVSKAIDDSMEYLSIFTLK